MVSVLVLAGGVRAGGMRPAHAWVDLGFAVSGILILAQLCPPERGADMPVLWMLPLGQGSVAALTMARTRLITGAAGTAVIMGACPLAVSLHLSAVDVPASALTNTISFALFYAVAAAAVSVAWRLASRASEQRLVNLAQQRELAALSERARQFRVIHDSVLQTLEPSAIASSLIPSRSSTSRASRPRGCEQCLPRREATPSPAACSTTYAAWPGNSQTWRSKSWTSKPPKPRRAATRFELPRCRL